MIQPIDTSKLGALLYQLKATLRYSNPPVWRRVVVRSDMTLDRLHLVIQMAMGWTDSHLHQFQVGRTCYGVSDPDLEFGYEMLDEKCYTVADLAPAVKNKFIYEYDFGDSWEHEIRLEKTLPPDIKFKHPLCLAGANACPPEDCGGITGYCELLAAMTDPEHEEHETMKEWIGCEWNASCFELEATNARLRRLNE